MAIRGTTISNIIIGKNKSYLLNIDFYWKHVLFAEELKKIFVERTTFEFETIIKEWLRHSSDRMKRLES